MNDRPITKGGSSGVCSFREFLDSMCHDLKMDPGRRVRRLSELSCGLIEVGTWVGAVKRFSDAGESKKP